jgi:hypothetical protein
VGEATAAPDVESCGSLDRAVPWPEELPNGTVVVSDVETDYVVVTDCGVQTLVRTTDDDSCYDLTGHGLQRYPC